MRNIYAVITAAVTQKKSNPQKEKNYSSYVHSYFTLPEPEDLPGNLSGVLNLVFQNVSLVLIPYQTNISAGDFSIAQHLISTIMI